MCQVLDFTNVQWITESQRSHFIFIFQQHEIKTTFQPSYTTRTENKSLQFVLRNLVNA